MSCHREDENYIDLFAVAVVKNENILGHVPRKISAVACYTVLQMYKNFCMNSFTRQVKSQSGNHNVHPYYQLCTEK